MHLTPCATFEYQQFSGFGIIDQETSGRLLRLLVPLSLAVTEHTEQSEAIGLPRVRNSLRVYLIRFCILIQFFSVRCKLATSNRIKIKGFIICTT